MRKFEEFFKKENIIFYLCKLRAKYAKKRNKKHLIHLLTGEETYNYHVKDSENHTDYEEKFIDDLNKLFPSRRKWVNIGKLSRIDSTTGHRLTAVDKNLYSLLKTIRKYRKINSSEPFLQNLDTFIKDIQTSITDPNYGVEKPTVYPKLKEKKKKKEENKCRPISLFNLKDRVILSLTNRYLTQLLDKYFEDCSYAFRSKKNVEGTSLLSHHDCIRAILKFKSENEGKDLWVVECDMQKFYDSVNHKIIREQFEILMQKVQEEFSETNFSNPIHIFNSFLDCYCFNHDVLPLNADEKYWESHSIEKGRFEWVEEGLKAYYNDFITERIGIPQGGALSGLIANIVLNVADKEVLKTKVFYARFCDDMIILHPEISECELAKDNYSRALHELQLVPHKFCLATEMKVPRMKHEKNLPETSFVPFWNKKSKGPYKWAETSKDGFPWIGFVGYEMNYRGGIRVRKRSLLKELKKQKEVVNAIKDAILKTRRKSFGTISESIIHRLVGMSVGRIELRNFHLSENEMCWKNGFRELKMNPHAVRQIKQLDRNRNKLYYDVLKFLDDLKEREGNIPNSDPTSRQIVDFNKPFSYFYQVLERSETND